MTRSVFALFLSLAVASTLVGCDGSTTAAEGLCITAVNVDGAMFTLIEAPLPAAEAVSTEVYLTVTRDTGCLDQGEASDPLVHGESNFLPVGTTLHEVDGYGPDERLAVWRGNEEESGWRFLVPVYELAYGAVSPLPADLDPPADRALSTPASSTRPWVHPRSREREPILPASTGPHRPGRDLH